MSEQAKRDDGGSAFPSHGSMGEVEHRGMTLRQYYAGKAIVAAIPLVAAVLPDASAEQSARVAARLACGVADALLAELAK